MLFLGCHILLSQDLPLGYTSILSDDFSKNKIGESFIFSSQSDFSIEKGALKLTHKPDSNRTFTPSAVMIIDNNIFGDFIAYMRVKCTGISQDSISGFYLIAGLKDSLNYYTICLNEQGIRFSRIYNGEDSLLSYHSRIRLIDGDWIEIYLKRDILSRSIQIKCGKEEIVFTDPNLVMGYLGIGTEGYSVELDKMKVWAPTSIEQPAPVFYKDSAPKD